MTSRNAEHQCWLAELSMLLWRHSDLGIGSDVDAMRVDELRAVYRFLTRLQKATEVCDE
jgi:hypothetical protein